MKATSPYLNRPLRTLEEVEAELGAYRRIVEQQYCCDTCGEYLHEGETRESRRCFTGD